MLVVQAILLNGTQHHVEVHLLGQEVMQLFHQVPQQHIMEDGKMLVEIQLAKLL